MPDDEKVAEEFVPTKAEDYPLDKVQELVLPSGAKVRVKRPSKYVMLRTGAFPKDVEEAIRAASTDRVEPDFDTRLAAMDYVLCASFVEPKVSIAPKKGHVCVRDLPDPDREYLVLVLGLSVF